MTIAVFEGFQTLLIYWGIPEFYKTLNNFGLIPVKIQKILRKFIDFHSNSLSHFYKISNVFHGGCVVGGGGIFWNNAIQTIIVLTDAFTDKCPFVNVCSWTCASFA